MVDTETLKNKIKSENETRTETQVDFIYQKIIDNMIPELEINVQEYMN